MGQGRRDRLLRSRLKRQTSNKYQELEKIVKSTEDSTKVSDEVNSISFLSFSENSAIYFTQTFENAKFSFSLFSSFNFQINLPKQKLIRNVKEQKKISNPMKYRFFSGSNKTEKIFSKITKRQQQKNNILSFRPENRYGGFFFPEHLQSSMGHGRLSRSFSNFGEIGANEIERYYL